MINENIQDKINKTNSNLTPLKDQDIQFFSGIETGLDDAFIIDGSIKDELIATDENNKKLIKPFPKSTRHKR